MDALSSALNTWLAIGQINGDPEKRTEDILRSLDQEIKAKNDLQSLPMIAIGHCPNLNGIQFYNPVHGTFVSSIDYKFQHHTTSGTHFGYKYQPGTFIYHLDESTSVFAPKFGLDSNALVHTHSPSHVAKVTGIPSYDCPDAYTVVFNDGSIAEYSDSSNILEAVPDSSAASSTSILPTWIQGVANATLFLLI